MNSNTPSTCFLTVVAGSIVWWASSGLYIPDLQASEQGTANSERNTEEENASSKEKSDLLDRAKTHFQAIMPVPEARLNSPKATLGRDLFWDVRLSANGQIACASCHLAKNWGADEVRFSLDARGNHTSRNSQTIFNALLQPKLRWTGDRDSGAHQAERSIIGSMGFSDAGEIVPLLERFGYADAFQAAFPNDPQPVSPHNYALAIQDYEETLLTPSAFDQFLQGDDSALNRSQKDGLELFMSIGCVDCHHGSVLGGNSIEKFGIHKDYWTVTHSDHRDSGVFNTTKNEEDRNQFRVSMLRNIAKTGPYFHDGSVSDLESAIGVMAEVQLEKQLSQQDLTAIASFLESLTGDVPTNYSSTVRK